MTQGFYQVERHPLFLPVDVEDDVNDEDDVEDDDHDDNDDDDIGDDDDLEDYELNYNDYKFFKSISEFSY